MELRKSNVPQAFHFPAQASQRCKEVYVHKRDSNSRISEHWSESLNTNINKEIRAIKHAIPMKLVLKN